MKQRLPYPYILFLLIILAFIGLMKFNGLYGQDSYEYLRYTKCIKEFVKTGNNPGDYFWPMLYPIIGACFSFLFPLPFALQVISILSLILSAIYLEKLLLLLFHAEQGITRMYILLFFLLSPYVLRGSMVVMPDSLTILCITSGCYYFEKYRRTFADNYFLLVVSLFAAAVCTRYAAFIIVFPLAVIALSIFFRKFKPSVSLLSIGVVFLIFLPHLIIRRHFLFSFIHHEWYDSWSLLNLFRRQFNTSNGYSSYFFYNIFYAFFNVVHPAFCFAGIILLLASLRNGYNKLTQSRFIVYAISILLYALFMAGIPFQDMRYLLLPFPLILIVLFPGYQYLADYFKAKTFGKYIIAGVIFIQLALFCRVFIPFYKDNQTEKQIANSMLQYSNRTLCTFSIDGALKNYGFNGKIINMWLTKIDTIRKPDSTVLVLFNTRQFYEVWKNGNPMQNWDFLHKKYTMLKLQDMPGGWALYTASKNK